MCVCADTDGSIVCLSLSIVAFLNIGNFMIDLLCRFFPLRSQTSFGKPLHFCSGVIIYNTCNYAIIDIQSPSATSLKLVLITDRDVKSEQYSSV